MLYSKRLIIILCFLLPVQLFAQPASLDRDLTGLWRGTLYNDTTGKILRYEIAISEYKGKLSGYTHTFFIIDDRQYYGVKSIKIRKQDGKLVLETDKLIADNYPVAPAKGVKQIDMLTLDIRDSIMILSGPFTTTRTREYHPLTGSIKVQRKNDLKQSALLPHLEELGLSNDLSFMPKPEPAIVAVVKKEPPVKKEKPVKEKPIEPATVVTKPEPVITAPAADVANRKIETIQSVYFQSDSLVLALYDNGEIDGDTVSVLLNGNVIIPKQGLTAKAFRKTIYTKDLPDSIQLVMYAETLGSIPPNTGLLVVHDGENIYEIRFSGDYQTNAAIIFRRKKDLH